MKKKIRKVHRHKRRLNSPYYKSSKGRTLIINPDVVSGAKKRVNVWRGWNHTPDSKIIGNPHAIEYPTQQDVADDRFNFNVMIQVAVPSTKNATEPISKKDFEARVESVITFLGRLFGNSKARIFGGTTSNTDYGTYYSGERKQWIGENVVLVTVWTTKQSYAKWDLYLKEWLKKKCREWKQESIQFIYSDGELKNSFLIFG